MRSVYKVANFVIICLIILSMSGCSKQPDAIKNENEPTINTDSELTKKVKELEDKVARLQSDIQHKEKENKQLVESLAKEKETQVVIDYVEVYGDNLYKMYNKKVFIAKENVIHALPHVNSYGVNDVVANTVATVIWKGITNNETWVYVIVPTLDSMANNRGWIKESETTEYTADKMKLVADPVGIKTGANAYQTYNFEDIKATKPITFNNEGGRILERRDGYCKISLAGGRDVWVKESDIVYPKTN